MAARIVHFGVDESFRLAILSSAGFEVEDCDSSIPQFTDALRKHPDAIVLSEDEGFNCAAQKAATLARSECKAPVILFRSAGSGHEYSQIDLIIPSLTEPSIWLQAIHKTIQRSRTLLEMSQSIREESAILVQQCTEARMKSEATRRRAAHLRSEAKKHLGEDQSQSNKASDD